MCLSDVFEMFVKYDKSEVLPVKPLKPAAENIVPRGHTGLKVTARTTQKLGSKIGPLQCREKIAKNIPLQCIFEKKFTLTVHF